MKITEDLADKIIHKKLLSEQLPYAFGKDKSACIKHLNCNCAKCGRALDDTDMRGEMISLNGHSVAIAGHAVCYDCKILTPFEVRLADDGSSLTKSQGGYTQGRWHNVEKSSWSSLWSRIKSMMGA